MIIFSRYEDEFGKRIFEEMKKYDDEVKYIPFSYRIFSDDENLVRFSDPPIYSPKEGKVIFPSSCEKVKKMIKNDGRAVLVNRGSSGRNWKPVHDFLAVVFATKYLKYELGAKKVYVVLPNMPFSKQDKLFYDENGNLVDGQPITIKYAREILRDWAKADLLLTVTPHDFRKTGWIVKDKNRELGWKRNKKNQIINKEGRIILPKSENWTGFAYAVDVMPDLAEYVLNMLEHPFVIGGDKSVKNAIKMIKRKYNIDGTFSEKFRNKYFNEMIEMSINTPQDLSKYDVVLLDDVIITAGTMKMVIKEIKRKNPKSITCAAVHGEFSYNKEGKSGLDVLKEEGANVIVTNTIETPVSYVDVAPRIAEKLYELL